MYDVRSQSQQLPWQNLKQQLQQQAILNRRAVEDTKAITPRGQYSAVEQVGWNASECKSWYDYLPPSRLPMPGMAVEDAQRSVPAMRGPMRSTSPRVRAGWMRERTPSPDIFPWVAARPDEGHWENVSMRTSCDVPSDRQFTRGHSTAAPPKWWEQSCADDYQDCPTWDNNMPGRVIIANQCSPCTASQPAPSAKTQFLLSPLIGQSTPSSPNPPKNEQSKQISLFDYVSQDAVESQPRTGISNMVSLGSVGHPMTCAEPCKYADKARGCKDGASCNRCHLCKWYRYAPRNGQKLGNKGRND